MIQPLSPPGWPERANLRPNGGRIQSSSPAYLRSRAANVRLHRLLNESRRNVVRYRANLLVDQARSGRRIAQDSERREIHQVKRLKLRARNTHHVICSHGFVRGLHCYGGSVAAHTRARGQVVEDNINGQIKLISRKMGVTFTRLANQPLPP